MLIEWTKWLSPMLEVAIVAQIHSVTTIRFILKPPHQVGMISRLTRPVVPDNCHDIIICHASSGKDVLQGRT